MSEDRREQPRADGRTTDEEYRAATQRREVGTRLGAGSSTMTIEEIVADERIPEQIRAYTQNILDQTKSDPDLHRLTTGLLDTMQQASEEARQRVSDFVRASNSRIMLIAVRRWLRNNRHKAGFDPALTDEELTSQIEERIKIELMLGHVPLSIEQLEDENHWMSLGSFQRFFAVCIKLVPVPNAIRLFAREFKRQGYGPADIFIKALANTLNLFFGPLVMPQLNRTGGKTIEDVLKLFNGNKDKPVVKFGDSLPPFWKQPFQKYDWITIDVALKPELQLDPIRDDGWSIFGGLIAGPFRHVCSVLGASDAHGFVLDYPNLGLEGAPEPSWEVCFPGDPLAIVEFYQEWRRLCPSVGTELAAHCDGNTIYVNGLPTLRRAIVTHDDSHEFNVELVTDEEIDEDKRHSPVWVAIRSIAWGESYDEDLYVPVFKRGVLYGMPFLRLRGWYEFPPWWQKIGNSLWNSVRFGGQFLAHPINGVQALWRYAREFGQGKLIELEAELDRIREQIDRYHLQALQALDSVLADTAKIREATGEAKQALIEDFKAKYRLVGQDTMGHVDRVELYATGITDFAIQLFPHLANHLNREHMELAARFHDWGKMFIHPDVLNKAGKPDPWEFDYLKSHINGTIFLLELCEFIPPVREIAGNHHQRGDGTGYPARPVTDDQGKPIMDEAGQPVMRPLTADEMSLGALFLIGIDVYDAMRSTRSYKPGLPRHVVINTQRQAADRGHFPYLTAALFLVYVVQIDEPETPLSEQELADIRHVLAKARTDPQTDRFGVSVDVLERHFDDWLASR